MTGIAAPWYRDHRRLFSALGILAGRFGRGLCERTAFLGGRSENPRPSLPGRPWAPRLCSESRGAQPSRPLLLGTRGLLKTPPAVSRGQLTAGHGVPARHRIQIDQIAPPWAAPARARPRCVTRASRSAISGARLLDRSRWSAAALTVAGMRQARSACGLERRIRRDQTQSISARMDVRLAERLRAAGYRAPAIARAAVLQQPDAAEYRRKLHGRCL